MAAGYLAAVEPIHAATDIWTGGTDANWATNANWSPATAPGAADTALFNGAGNSNTTISLGSGITTGNIFFDTASAAAYTIGSGAVNSQTLTLGNGGSIVINPTETKAQLFNAGVVLGTDGSTQTFTLTNNSSTAAAVLDFAGSITGSSGLGEKTVILGGSNAGTLGASGAVYNAIAGNITEGSGTVALVKTGGGTWVINPSSGTIGADTFSGGISLNGGTLIEGPALNKTNLLSPIVALTGNGGTFGLDATGGGSGTPNQTFAGYSAATGQSTVYVGRGTGSNALLTLGSYARAAGATTLFAGTSATLNTFGAGAPSGGTILGNSGSITITGASSGFMDQGTFVQYATNVSGGASAPGISYAWYDTSLNSGKGSVRAINYGVDSGTTTTAGTTSITGTFNNVQTTGAITAQTTNTFETLNISSLTGSSADAFTLAAGATLTVNGILVGNPGSAAFNASSIFSGGTGIQAGHNQDLVIEVSASNTTVFMQTAVLANGTNALTKAGVGTLSLQAVNSYTGGTYIDEGTILIASTGTALGSTSGLLQIDDAGTLDLAGHTQTVGVLTMGVDGVSNSAATQALIEDSTGTGTLNTSGVVVNSVGNTIGANTTVTGVITQNASSGLIVNGTAGADALATGATLGGTGTVGAVTLAGNNTLGSTGTLTTAGITVNGTGNTIAFGSTLVGAITQNAGSALAVNGTAGNVSLNGTGTILSGTGTVGAIILNSGAAIAPGASGAGTLTGGAMSWNGGGGLDFSLSTTSLNTSTKLSITSLTKGTTGAFDVTITGGFTGSTLYDLMNFGSQTGFASASDFTLINDSGLSGHLVLTSTDLEFQVDAVPEPATLALIALGMLIACSPLMRRLRLAPA